MILHLNDLNDFIFFFARNVEKEYILCSPTFLSPHDVSHFQEEFQMGLFEMPQLALSLSQKEDLMLR